LKLALLFVLGAALIPGAARADLLWRWTCAGSGFEASGAFTTGSAPNADGFYEIKAITGEAGGVAITRLQPTGTAIPLNQGFPVSNLVREAKPQLSVEGFAFALANGAYANPFFGARFSPPGFYAFLSDPGTGKTSEPMVEFAASLVGPAK
jgi:hypothetical protein